MSRSGSASCTTATWRSSIRTACRRLTRCSGPRSALSTSTASTVDHLPHRPTKSRPGPEIRVGRRRVGGDSAAPPPGYRHRAPRRTASRLDGEGAHHVGTPRVRVLLTGKGYGRLIDDGKRITRRLARATGMTLLSPAMTLLSLALNSPG